MYKISLAALTAFTLFWQPLSAQKNTRTDSVYAQRVLKFEEANIVSAYYAQNGNYSAVTGGIGTERLSDFSNTFDISVSLYDRKARKHNLSMEMGIDHYTSASSDNIDPKIKVRRDGEIRTSASYSDQRYYPSLNYRTEKKNGWALGGGLSYSTEWDYRSRGLTLNATKTSADKNREFGIRAGAFFDTWEVILPIELRTGGGREEEEEQYEPRNSFNLALNFAQVVNKRLQVGLMLEPNYQQGLLATKYQRVYFTDGTVQSENLPNQRWKLPVGIRANCFVGNRLILKPFYRFYTDKWGLTAHSATIEAVIKLSPSVSLSPFYRYYKQQGISYFKAYGQTEAGTTFFTSDYDLAALSSHHFGTGVRWVPQNGVFGVARWYAIELRFAHYTRNPDLRANILTLAIKVK